MVYKNIALISILLSGFYSFGQVDKIKLASDSLVGFYIKGDFQNYVDRVYPPIVEMAGGKEPYMRNIKLTADAWKNAGFVTRNLTYESVLTAVQAGEELHTIITYKAEYLVNDNTFEGNVYFLAISNDNGIHWRFLNLDSYDKEGIVDFVPNYNSALAFPLIEAPVLKEK
jgi:hypothetical protein